MWFRSTFQKNPGQGVHPLMIQENPDTPRHTPLRRSLLGRMVSRSVGESAVKHQFASQALLIYFHANAELCTDLEASKCRVCHGLLTTLPMTMSIFGISDIHIWTNPCSHFKASENYKNFGSSTSQHRCRCQGDVQKFFDCGFGAILCPEVCFLGVKNGEFSANGHGSRIVIVQIMLFLFDFASLIYIWERVILNFAMQTYYQWTCKHQ